MKRKLLLKRAAFAITLVLVLAVAMAFPFGPLLPWSPIKPGYGAQAFARGKVFFNQADAMPVDYQGLDDLMKEAEAFHHLQFHEPVTVLDCKNWRDCERAIPWMNMRGLGGLTLATGDVIYITPKLREKNFSIREYLRHELSHALLSQNTTIVKSYKLNRVPWFFEGLAVSFGRQRNYFSRQEFQDRAAKEDLAGVLDPAKTNPASPDWNARFAYTAQRYFVEYLRQKFGEERFAEFIKRSIADPDRQETLVQESFGQPLGDLIAAYQTAVRSNEWLPIE